MSATATENEQAATAASASTQTLFTLPAHLKDTIASLVAANIAPPGLQANLQRTLQEADRVVFEEESELAVERDIVARAKGDSSNGASSDKGKSKEGTAAADSEKATSQDDEETEKDDPFPPVPTLRPATIDSDVLDALEVWATRNGMSIKQAGLDPAAFGTIALLAGTTVYLPPRQRGLARAAEANASDKPNPYLPSHLSARPPSLGSEYRSMLSMLSTVLNILFSIFGAGGAAYAAATTGAGWGRESAILLAVFVGVVVGIADLGLLAIYQRRKDKKVAAEEAARIRENRGSGKLAGSDETVLELDDEAAKLAELERQLDDAIAREVASTGNGPAITIPPVPATQPLNIRLRRRPKD